MDIEREAFEEWFFKKEGCIVKSNRVGETYTITPVATAWSIWKARADLAELKCSLL